eukprot:gb/GECG01003692.1/.p1 GENE.gb/GECG01003692.1/~~gb/GECG01003692.1/.p1  ORF type:complete len:263 (+),score=44.92 gb/GECG01003692.1/:1-789(+)
MEARAEQASDEGHLHQQRQQHPGEQDDISTEPEQKAVSASKEESADCAPTDASTTAEEESMSSLHSRFAQVSVDTVAGEGETRNGAVETASTAPTPPFSVASIPEVVNSSCTTSAAGHTGNGTTEAEHPFNISTSAPSVGRESLRARAVQNAAADAADGSADTTQGRSISSDRHKEGSDSSRNNSNGDSSSKKKVKPKRRVDFLYGKELGVGAYAQVVHCRDRNTHTDYACKVMDRRFIVKEKKVRLTVMPCLYYKSEFPVS